MPRANQDEDEHEDGQEKAAHHLLAREFHWANWNRSA
jgi:hypothetical protein